MDDDFVLEQDRELMGECLSSDKLPELFSVGFTIVIFAENGNPDMYLHKAPPLSEWIDMPDFSSYLKKTHNAYSSIRTLLYYDNPKPFYDFYVCNNIEMRPYYYTYLRFDRSLRHLETPIENATVLALAKISNYIVITGTGGLGKSMMMRNLLLTSISSFSEAGMIPLFVPLKDYSLENSDLFDYIYNTIPNERRRARISKEQYADLLLHNRIILLLDGYDEIKSLCVQTFDNALKDFIHKYPNNMYIISSRPFEPNGIFKRFLHLSLVPFSLTQSIKLIEKLEFRPDEPGIKEKFIQQLESTLYQTHTEFASNPLLLTIMLMTFEQFAEVPSKMHVFYREAYATLSQKHDASKGAYKRALKTGLSADRFADYFSEFCARTYAEEKYEMTHKDITECFNKLNIRKRDENLKFTSDDFIYDLQNNLCLLYYESGKYHFTHRSFQEYFCALYFSKQKDKALERIGESFEHRKYQSNSDKTFSMLYDMIPDKVEEYIFLPYLQKVFDKCSGPNGYWQYLTKYVKFVIAGPMHHYLRDAEVKNQLSVPISDSFIRGFILSSVISLQEEDFDVEFPFHKEFVNEVYSLMYYPNGKERIVPSKYVDELSLSYIEKDGKMIEVKQDDITITPIYEYHFPFSKIFKAKDSYPDLIAIFESEDFPLHKEYTSLKNYYEKLKKSLEDEDDDSLSFLS